MVDPAEPRAESRSESRLYVPHFNRMPEDDVRDFVEQVGTGTLITTAADGRPDATFLPVLWRGETVVGHLARANCHWRRMVDGAEALLSVVGADGYVSPSWYPSKREHGRVVPTWNYEQVQLRGPVRVVDDRAWLADVVAALTDRHEAGLDHPWRVTDAPDDYVATQLRAIVGVEMTVTSVEAKAKLSQNRSEEDRAGVLAGQRATGRHHAAERLADSESRR